MLLPFGRFADHIRREFEAGSADPVLRILTERTNMVGQISKAMLLIRLPEPVRRRQREITAARFAFAQRRLGSLERAGMHDQCPEKESKPGHRAKRRKQDKNGLATPVGEHSVFRG